ncbi:MAG: hypothetical protein H0V17_14720 [Deltaproteobacteria bacterium]|nr:hypothetical protein [Deltaproteobacteria bacterium]
MGMFEDEADTISVQPGFDSKPMLLDAIDAFEITKPIELETVDTFRDTDPLEAVVPIEDTDILVISRRLTSMSDDPTNVRSLRASTNADWPPAPKQPATRKLRTAGTYNAISSTKLPKSS